MPNQGRWHHLLSLPVKWCVQVMRWTFNGGRFGLVLVCAGTNAGLLPPSIYPEGGIIRTPEPIVIANPNSNGAIFYSINGLDPRDSFGNVASYARCYRIPISVNRSLLILARVKSGSEWSPMVAAAFTGDQDFHYLLFTEVMYHPTDQLGLEVEEFIELKNVGDVHLNLSGLHLRDMDSGPPQGDVPPIFTFPADAIIPPGGFFILAFDTNVFHSLYPGVPVFGEFSFRGSGLNERSARLALHADNGAIATVMRYWTHNPWPVVPDNHGYFTNDSPSVGFSLVRSTLNVEADPEDFSTWRASTHRLGSPGADDPEPLVRPIYVNEILTRSSGSLQDTVELYNPHPMSMELGGWWLSDARNFPYKYRIPTGTIIPSMGYLVLDESHFNIGEGGFAFSANGDRCYIFSGDTNGNLTGYSHGFVFRGSDRNVTFGRNRSSTGEDYWLPENSLTFGTTNSGPHVPSLMITEIMYHPEAPENRFIELKNTTDTSLDLGNHHDPLRAWIVGYDLPFGDLGSSEQFFLFPATTTVPAGGYILLVSGIPHSFRSTYNVPEEVTIIQLPETFSFSHSGTLRIHRPTAPEDMRYVVIDEVKYRNHWPWDPGAAGGGQSLERINFTSYGSDPIHWRASPTGSSPGRDNSLNQAPLVWAGQNRIAFAGYTTQMSGIVSDDRWPNTSLTSSWTQVSGPVLVDITGNAPAHTTVAISQPGTYVLRLTATDGILTSSDDVVLEVITRPFDIWRGTNFSSAELDDDQISGPMADPDRDGSNNVQEYFFCTLPKQANLPRYHGWVESNQFGMAWKQRLYIPDVDLEVERADSIEGPWFGGPGLFERVQVDEPSLGLSDVLYHSLLPSNLVGQQFFRLRIRLRDE